MAEQKSTIERLKAQLAQAQERSDAANRECRELEDAIVAARTAELGLVAGETVLQERGRFDRRGVFRELEEYDWAVVRLLKNDGTAGKREIRFFDWEVADG